MGCKQTIYHSSQNAFYSRDEPIWLPASVTNTTVHFFRHNNHLAASTSYSSMRLSESQGCRTYSLI